MQKMVITCAVCGAETTRKDNPNLPLTPEEIASSTFEAYRAGASIVHLHVRDSQGLPTQDLDIFSEAIRLIREKCDIVIEVTTGGAVGMTDEERLQVISLKPEMASLDCGTVNFGNEYIINSLPTMRKFATEMKKQDVRPTLECFDLSHIYAANLLISEGLLAPPFHFGFVMNVPGGVAYSEENLAFFVKKIPEGSFWTVMGIGGKASLDAHYGAISLNGFIRVGMEDNVYIDKGKLAGSNAELVTRAAKIAKDANYDIADASYVRELFKIRSPQE